MTTALRFTRSHVLRNEREYEAAVAEIERLLEEHPKPKTEAFERLRFLAVLVEAYEEERFPFDEKTTPQVAVALMLEQKGLTRADLATWIGGKSRVSEFFRGRRKLSLAQVRILHERMGIPADLLIR